MKIVKISPKTNFHTYLHSDTLWGNLVYAYKLLYNETALENLLKNYLEGNNPFVVSSVFPYEIIKNGSNQIIYYFPKPLLGGESIQAESPEDMTIMKEFKSIRFVEQRIFEEYLNGKVDDKKLFEKFRTYREAEEKLKKAKSQEEIKIYEELIDKNKFRYISSIKPIYNLHNSIDRMRGSTLEADGRGQLYWEDEIALGDEMGLFFLVEVSELDVFKSLLRLLSHIGIGGNRSIGKGSFDFQIEDFSFSTSSDKNGYISLSLYHPSKEELEILSSVNTNLFYDISTRIGFVGKDFSNVAQEKNPVNCFTEGSTFFVKEKLEGCLVSTAKIYEQKEVYSSYLFFGVKGNLRSI
jgi:CRISPR-associated protein Csm4